MAETLTIGQEIARALEEGMKEKGIDWLDLEDRTGVTRTTVQRWKSGASLPKVETAMLALGAAGYELRVVKKS